MVKILDICAGIGAFRMAAEQLGHECFGYVEYDKFPRKSYEAIYDTTNEWTSWDVTKVTDEEWQAIQGKVDIITAGFPCQSFSVSGKGLGFEDSRGTVFFDVARAIKNVQPEKFVLENVKNLVSHDKGKTIETIIKTLNEIGYTVDMQVLNSKYYDVPQNRERVFIVGIKDGETEKWNIKGSGVLAKAKKRISEFEWAKTFNFDYPTSDKVTTRLKDILEPEEDIPSNLYISPEKTQTLINSIIERDEKLGRNGAINALGLLDMKGNTSIRTVYDTDGLCPTLTTMQGGHRQPKVCLIQKHEEKSDEIIMLGLLDTNGIEQAKRVHDPNGISPTLTTMGGGNLEPKICLVEDLKDENQKEPSIQIVGNTNPSGKGLNGQVFSAESNSLSPTLMTNKGEGIKIAYCPILNPDKINFYQNGRRLKEDGEDMFTLTVVDRHGVVMYDKNNQLKSFVVRKLSPRECWRLQSFPDWAFDKATEVNSNSQLYKQAGNSITVNVARAILEKLI